MGDENSMAVASKAMAQYNAKEYAASVRTMQKLQNQEEDYKVTHNMALAEYKMGDCKQPKVLLETLKKAEIDATPKTEDATGPDHIASMSILRFNQAVLLVQLKQYNEAMVLLEQMYSTIQHQEDQVGFKVCFLLLDVYYLLKQASKAVPILNFLSAPTTFTELSKKRNEDLGSEGLEAQLEKDPSDVVPPNAQTTEDLSGDDKTKRVSNGLSLAQFRFNMHLYKTRFYLLNRNYKLAQKEIKAGLLLYQKETKAESKTNSTSTKTTGTTTTTTTTTTATTTTPITSEEGTITTSSLGNDGTLTPANAATAFFLKSNLEYMRANYHAAIKLLNICMVSLKMSSSLSSSASSLTLSTSSSSSSPSSTSCSIGPSLSLYFNNLGCTHFRMQKFSSAGFCFSKAFTSQAGDSGEREASVDGDAEFKAQLLYNIALQQLTCGENLELAFSLFQACRPYYSFFSLLWFRLAECCLKNYQQKQSLRQRHPIIGNKKRRAILSQKQNIDNKTENTSEDNKDSEEKHDDANVSNSNNSTNSTNETLSLEYGIKCLRNSLYLLSLDPTPQVTNNNNSASTAAPSAASSNQPAAAVAPNPPAASVQLNDFDADKNREMNRETQRMACLVNLMYAELSVNNPVSCMRDGARLLAMKNVPTVYRYFAHMYCAEALCLLNAPDKALRELVTADKLEEVANPYPLASNVSPHFLKAALYCSMATTRIAKNELAEARECVNHALALVPDFSIARRCLLYLQLRQGNTNAALATLRGRRQPPPRARPS